MTNIQKFKSQLSNIYPAVYIWYQLLYILWLEICIKYLNKQDNKYLPFALLNSYLDQSSYFLQIRKIYRYQEGRSEVAQKH